MEKTKKRSVLRLNLFNREVDIYMDSIYSVIPKRMMVLLHPDNAYRSICDDPKDQLSDVLMSVTIKDKKIFNKVKFEWIKHIKTRKNPSDRVADFECEDDDGAFNYDKYDKLVEGRKTRIERQREIDAEISLIKNLESSGIYCEGLKQSLKDKINQ